MTQEKSVKLPSPYLLFLKEWGSTIALALVLFLSWFYIWNIVTVSGHSMDPTLAEKDRLLIIKTAKIDRFDIVVASEKEKGENKKIVKRVIGMPGDTITYKNDTLYVNGKKTDEDYLSDYQKELKKDRLQSTYSYNSYFQQQARSAKAFTTDTNGNSNFTVKVKKGEYFLVGDDRIASKDSRAVGSFKKDSIIGEVKFRLWPFTAIGTVE